MTLKQQACFMLFTQFMFFFFFCWYEKVLLNFVSERIKLVFRINTTRLAFQTSKTTIYRPHTPELKSMSKFQLLFHWRNFEKYMIFYTLPWSRWNRTTCVIPFAIAELVHKCHEAAPTLKYGPLKSSITVLSVWIIKILQCNFLISGYFSYLWLSLPRAMQIQPEPHMPRGILRTLNSDNLQLKW